MDFSELHEPQERDTHELQARLLASAEQELKQFFTVHWILFPKQVAHPVLMPTPFKHDAEHCAWLALE